MRLKHYGDFAASRSGAGWLVLWRFAPESVASGPVCTMPSPWGGATAHGTKPYADHGSECESEISGGAGRVAGPVPACCYWCHVVLNVAQAERARVLHHHTAP